ncbi:MAG: bacterial Ig-like domain-containing protein, partial [Clostridia bacterium]|nr:bacterial Ig-like domain-containing protein [Clostridia bacterium]
TGEELYHKGNSSDTGRGMMANVGSGGFYQITGSAQVTAEGDGVFIEKNISLGNNFRIFWDGDLYDEMLNGTTVSNWNGNGFSNAFTASGCTQVNGTKANPSLQADLFGDWREEIVYPTTDSSELRVYTTTEKTDYKMKSLMYDKVYRECVAAEQTAYNQPPHIGYYVSEDSFYGTLAGIELDTTDAKTTYYLGDEFDKTGLKVTGKYSDADDRELSGYSVSGYDAMTVGEQTITVKYLGKSATYSVTVVGESGITVENSKTEYKVGEEFDKSALSVKLVYDNADEKEVSSFKVSGYDAMKTGEQTVTITYAGAEDTYTQEITVEVVTGLIVEDGVVTGYSGEETEIVIPISIGETAITGIADSAFADTSLAKIYIYSEDITFEGDNIFPEGVTIVCIEDSTAHEYAVAHNIAFELIEMGDSVTFDEEFYTAYAGGNMLMQNTSAVGTLKDEFVTYNTVKASNAPWFAADTYGFMIKTDADNNYLNINAGIYDDMNKFNQVYITLNTPVRTTEKQTVEFDVMFPSNSGSPYIEIQNEAGTVIDTISASVVTNDAWYRYVLAFADGAYTRTIYDASGTQLSKTPLSVTNGNTIVSNIVFKQEFNMQGGWGAKTGIVNIDNILLK